MAGSEENFSGSRYKRNSERRRTLTSIRESKGTALPAYLQRERVEDVLDALEAIETDVTLGRPVRWRELLPVIRGMTVNDETAPDCLNVAKALLGLFERYHCRDISVRSEVFRLLLSVTEPDHPILKQPIDFAGMFSCPYGGEATDSELVFSAVRRGELSLLKLQLKFGLGMALNSSSDSEYICYLLLTWLYNFHDDTTEDDDNTIENRRVRMQILREITTEKIEKYIRCNFNPESMKRLGLVLRIADILRARKFCRPDGRERFAECYRLLFESIPAAFVSRMEVKAFLEKFLPASCSPFISRMAEDFKNLLPELAEVPQPRSLKHLCRIEARQSLRRNLNLPHGVAQLPLPTKLKEYILLNDDGDYSVVTRSRSSRIWRDSHINIPERDDCVTSFLKNL